MSVLLVEKLSKSVLGEKPAYACRAAPGFNSFSGFSPIDRGGTENVSLQALWPLGAEVLQGRDEQN